MAKNQTENQTLNAQEEFEKLIADLPFEQQQELRRLSGMDNVNKGEALPVLKVNTQLDADKKGVEIKHGNFVINQVVKFNSTTKETELENAGTDLGQEVEVIIYAAPQQYSKYDPDPKKRCNSQLLFDSSDAPVGNTYGFNCRSGECPYRQEGVADKEKCGCQVVAYMQLVSDGTKVMSYHKKSNFMPMSNYLKSLGTLKPFMVKTKLARKKEKNGNVTYYVVTPERGEPISGIAMKETLQIALETVQGIKAFEAQRASKNTTQIAYSPRNNSSATDATFSNSTDVEDIQFD